MRPAHDILQVPFCLADGAMGSWFAQQSGLSPADCEAANLSQPQLIRQIHQAYVSAGARFLRTNTFAAASQYDPSQPDRLRDIVRSGWQIALDCSDDQSFVAADFGPVYGLDTKETQQAWQIVIDTFIESGAELFIFETFSDPDELLPWSRLIRHRCPRSVIIASFALSPDGVTRKGIPLASVALRMESEPSIDIWGFNCGIGPTHMRDLIQQLPDDGKPLTLMPNSGYPRLENQRLVYGSTPAYYAETVSDLRLPRVKLIGGCCGTTPRHIAALTDRLRQPAAFRQNKAPSRPDERPAAILPATGITLAEKLDQAARQNRPLLVCELDPPMDSDMTLLIRSARQLRASGIDAVTVADSPLARVKLDPIVAAARLQRETGITTLPHLTCRDRNANALRSSLLAMHSEGIRQVLAITGDAIPESDHGFVRPVFNLNSQGLLALISQMNHDIFPSSPLLAAAALDPGVANPQAELRRLNAKKAAGATLVLTQPVYDSARIELIRQARQIGLKVLIGIMPLVSYRNALYLSQEIPGIRIPAEVIARFHPEQPREQSIQIGIDLCVSLMDELKEAADGFYLIAPFNRADIIIDLCRQSQGLASTTQPLAGN